MEAGNVRKILGDDKIIGVSAQTVEQALLAQKHGADYLGVGAVFKTGSKDDADDVSHDELQKICEAVDIPVIAIGGISSKMLRNSRAEVSLALPLSVLFSLSPILQRQQQSLKHLRKRRLRMIKSAIFDVDGTLLDSMKIWDDAGERYLSSVGKTAENGLSEKLCDMSLTEGAEYMKKQYALSFQLMK